MEPVYQMTRTNKIVNMVGVFTPIIAFIAAVIIFWNHGIGITQLALLVGFYVFTGLGVTLGYHRLFTHRSFETPKWLRAIIAVAGSMAMEGSVITWVADHRKHHAFSDRDGDLHSPHLSGPGLWGSIKGLYHSHMGWLFEVRGIAERDRYAPDLMKEPMIVKIDKLFGFWALLTLVLPFAFGWLIGGSVAAALSALLWAGLVRVFLVHHVTWSVNSVCHFVGKQRFDSKDLSRNVFWLAPFSMGESWHHNHHAFPTSAFHGLSRSEKVGDLTGILIVAMEKVGLASKVVRISAERQADKLLVNVAKAEPAAGPAPTDIATVCGIAGIETAESINV